MSSFIQVGNLPDAVDSLALRRIFEVHGIVRNAKISRHHETGRSTGVGFVEMETESDCADAIAALHHNDYGGRVLSVCGSTCTPRRYGGHQQMFGPMNKTDGDATW